MRKKLLFTLWLLIPIVVLAFHYGPGQKGLAKDQVAAKIKAAQIAEQNEDWKAAVAAYAEALTMLPPGDQKSRFGLQLRHASARMYSGELPEAILEMEGILTDMLKENAESRQIRELRGGISVSKFSFQNFGVGAADAK